MRRSADQLCRICSAPLAVRQGIDQALTNGERLRDLEKRCGFSRSALSRHNRKHIARTALEEHRRSKSVAAEIHSGKRRLVTWTRLELPGQQLLEEISTTDEYGKKHMLTPDQLLPTDVVLRLQFEKPPAPRNPRPILIPENPAENPPPENPEQARTANSQTVFCTTGNAAAGFVTQKNPAKEKRTAQGDKLRRPRHLFILSGGVGCYKLALRQSGTRGHFVFVTIAAQIIAVFK